MDVTDRSRVQVQALRAWLRGPGLLLVLDAVLCMASFWLAMQLRFEGHVTEGYQATLWEFALLLACERALVNVPCRLHHWSFRFSGLADAARVGLAGLAGTGLFLGTVYFLRHAGPPRSVIVLELLLTTLGMTMIRFAPRLTTTYVRDWVRTQKPTALRTIIVGAGSAGEILLRDLQRSAAHNYSVIGFVDDDPAKRRMIVGGKSVLGTIDELGAIAARQRIGAVLIAIARLEGPRIREILSVCAHLKVRFKILPASLTDAERGDTSTLMKDLAPEDLLPRDPIVLEGRPRLDGRTALVTGAAGSIGSEITLQLARSGPGRLVLFDINENGQYMLRERLRRECPGITVHVEVGDIRDPRRILAVFSRHRPHDVFHAAAHKHVPLMEAAPCEAVKNNVQGTRHVAAAADTYRAERFIYISTDKAVRPTSVMGATKRLGEQIVRALAEHSQTRFCAVRFGNVLGSAGSVTEIFREQIAAGGPVHVTHAEVRRYFMTISEAVALVLKAGYSDYGELCVLDMGEQLRIDDLARHMITMAGLVPEVDIPIEYVGLRPGEKLYEELLTDEEEQTRQVNHKIFVATGPPPRPDLDRRVDELVAAASAEDDGRVVRLLRRLVPRYVAVSELRPVHESRERPDARIEPA